MSRPTAVEPVNAILSIVFERTRAAPVSPSPGRMVTTPGGSSASWQISASSSAVSGVVSAGFRIADVPARERRRELPRRHQQREVPRHDLPDDAERLDLARVRRRSGACPPSRRSGRSARPRAGCRRRGTPGAACRRRASRRPRARASAPGSAARSGTGTCRARERRSAAHFGCAARALSTAAITSSGPAHATSAIGSSVAGLIVGTYRPSAGSRNSPSTNSPYRSLRRMWSADSGAGA